MPILIFGTITERIKLFQDAFYDRVPEKEQATINFPEELTPETLAKMLENPEIMALIGALSKKL